MEKDINMDGRLIYCEKEIVESLKFYDENYDVFPLSYPEKRTYIQTEHEYVCRFCGKDKSKTTFKKIAHAIPEFTGNKTILTKNECDICNEEFGHNFEDHLAKFLLPANSFTQVKGKNGIPTYKNIDESIRIETIDNKLHITNNNSKNVIFDRKNKVIMCELESQQFIPIKAYCAFLKMALSIMPEKELVNFHHCIDYIKGKLNEPFKAFPSVLVTFTSGYQPYGRILNVICIRKKEDYNLPYLLYILGFGNFMYQVIVPSYEKDDLYNREKPNFTIKPFKSPYSYINDPSRQSTTVMRNLSGIEPITRPFAFRATYQFEYEEL